MRRDPSVIPDVVEVVTDFDENSRNNPHNEEFARTQHITDEHMRHMCNWTRTVPTEENN